MSRESGLIFLNKDSLSSPSVEAEGSFARKDNYSEKPTQKMTIKV